MASSKPKKSLRTPQGLELLKSDVASFASSLGLAPPSAASSAAGFDDSDFRKSGPLKPPKSRNLKPSPPEKIDDGEKKNKKDDSDSKPKPKPKPHPLQIDPFENDKDDKKDLPKLPLMKAISLSGQWYVDADDLEKKVLGLEGRKKLPALGIEELKKLVAKKKEVAEMLLRQYTREYDSSRRKSGDMRLLEATARSGTSADKVSAFTCLVEDNPIANMRSLDALLSMVTSKVGKRYAFTGFEALKELFLLRLLPDRKLKSLFQRPLDNLPETKDGFSLLLFWYWEECLKQRYERFVAALEEALKDMLPTLKDKAMKTVYALLKSKSEQERRLLTAIVNKLGDPERKAASTAAYHLSCLLSAHPNMKAVVIDEVDSFIFRPHIGLRAKYHAVNFLSQIFLTKKGDGPKIAKRVVDIYFALFKVLISEANDGKNMSKKAKNDKKSVHGKENDKNGKGKTTSSLQNGKKESFLESNVEMDSRLLSALLTGVNRAFPFVSSEEADDIIEVQTPILYRLVHSENFNVGVQALMLLYQITSKNQIAGDRFYRALYSKLLIPAAVTSSKPEMFLGLLVKAMKNDIHLKRVAAFSKRLLQVALQRPPQYACGCLFILSEVLRAKPPLWTMVLQNESVDDELEHFEDIIEGNEDLAMAPSGNTTNSGCSNALQAGKKLKNSNYKEDNDSEVEDGHSNGSRIKTVSDGSREAAQISHMRSNLPAGYDPRHREPSYCNADRASWWELTVLAAHVHPSVATMARTLLSGANIVYNGDPLNDLSLGAFLDKFMEKKPKQNRRAEGTWHGGSQIAPARKLDLNHRLIGDEILQLAEDEVPPEDVVFHRFYMNKTSSSKKPKAKKKKDSQDDEDAEDLLVDASAESDEEEIVDASDESDEEEIDNMLGSGHSPLVEAEGEYDYDDLDRVAVDDDEDLILGGSDAEPDSPPNLAVRKHDEDDDGSLDIMGSIGEGVDIDDDGSSQSAKTKKGKKRKLDGRTRASPFANLEEYEHLMNDNVDATKVSRSHKRKKTKAFI